MRKIYQLVKKNKLEKVIENFFSLSILEIAVYGFKLITIPYIAKTIGLEKFGIIAFAAAFCNFFIIIVDYGFHLSAVKDIAKNKSDINKVNFIFTKVFFSKLILLLFSILIFLSIVLSVSILRDNYVIYIFSFMVVINNVIYPQWFFHGIEKMKFITILNVFIHILYLISIFTFIKTESDYIYIPMLLGLSTFLIGIISIIIIFNKYKVRFVNIGIKDIIQTFNDGKYIFVNQFFPYLYKNSSVLLLGIFAPLTSVGLYSAAERIINVCSLLIKVLTRSFFPHLAHSHQNFKLYSRIMILTSIFMLALLILFSKPIFNILYTQEFAEGLTLLYIMSIGIFFIALYNCFGTNGLIHKNREKLLMKSTMFSSVSAVMLSCILIYYFQEFGAAIGVVLGRAMMGLSVFYIYKKIAL